MSQMVHRIVARYLSAGRFSEDATKENKHAQAAKKAFRFLVEETEPQAERATAFSDDIKKQKRYFVSEVRMLSGVLNFLTTYLGTKEQDSRAESRHQSVIYLLRDIHLDPKVSLSNALPKIEVFARDGYKAIEMSISQAPLRAVLPETIREFLPKNIVVDVDPTGHISSITDRFGNARDTLEKKIQHTKTLVAQYNEVAKKVKADLNSNVDKIRIAATITGIILETGIRPGAETSSANIRDEKGNKIEVETFGASNLRLKHVNYIRRDLVILDFIGKKGKNNVVAITDPKVIEVLMEYADYAMGSQATVEESLDEDIFVLDDGLPFTYKMFMTYFKNRVSSKLTPKVIRSLKATETILNNLHDQQASLYQEIRRFVDDEVKDLQQRITEAVTQTIRKAVESAQRVLHHETYRVTLDSYASPQPVLNFLSQGGVERDLKKEILQNTASLRFDPNIFLEKALAKRASSESVRYGRKKSAKNETLLDILNDLVESLGIHPTTI